MADRHSGAWRPFWMTFAAGWALLIAMAATNSRMATPVSPNGILDHQSAATGARAGAIQQGWADAHVLDFARLSIGTDLVYIGVLTVAALIGCALIARRANGPLLRGFVFLLELVWLAYGASDYIETIAQFVEVESGATDPLAAIAAAMGPAKVATFIAGHAGLLVALLWLPFAPRKAVAAV